MYKKGNTMCKLVLIALAAVAVAFSQQGDPPKQPAVKAAPSKAKVLSREEVDQLLASPDKVLFLDLRRPDEIATNGGFPVYLSIQIGELEKHLAEIPRDRLIVTVSNHSGRSGRAADLLASKGFKVAGAAGAETYQSQGGTLVKVVPPPKIEK
jgi:rhodanese-related sulfurtransferase